MVWKRIRTKFMNTIDWVDKTTGGSITLVDERNSLQAIRRGFWVVSNVRPSLYNGKIFTNKRYALAFVKSLIKEY